MCVDPVREENFSAKLRWRWAGWSMVGGWRVINKGSKHGGIGQGECH